MTQKNHLTAQPIHPFTLAKRMLLGAGIALVPLTLLLLQVEEPDPAWPKLWMLRPLIIVPLAGAMGGLFYYLMNYLFHLQGWRKILVNILCLVVYLVGIWMGTVLGLNGTLWH